MSLRSAPYITAAGAAALKAELQHLWREKRPEVTRKVAEAAAMGDRSENAEYIYGKKQLREIDRRVRYLSKRLEQLKVVDRPPDDQDKVYFGAWVSLEDADGREVCWRIVGADEFDPRRGWISLDSPAARAMLGKRCDDEIEIHGPDGSQTWWITAIRYSDAAED